MVDLPDARSVEWHLSGGASNTDKDRSLGGNESSTIIDYLPVTLIENLFRSFTAQEAIDGATVYRCIYAHNATGHDIKNCGIFTQGTESTGTAVAMHMGLAAAGEEEPISIPNEFQPPQDIVFSPNDGKSQSDPIPIGIWRDGQRRSIWLRLKILPGAGSYEFDNMQIYLFGDWSPTIT